MDRPALLAVPAALLAALVVPLRSIVAFQSLQEVVDLTVLALLARPLWMSLAVVGFAAVGYAYGTASNREQPRVVLGVAALSTFVGVAVGTLIVRFGTDATVAGRGSLVFEMGLLGGYVVLDAAMFALVALGGYALTFEASRSA